MTTDTEMNIETTMSDSTTTNATSRIVNSGKNNFDELNTNTTEQLQHQFDNRNTSTFDATTKSTKSLADMIGISSYQHKLIIQYWPKMYGTGGASQGAAIYVNLCNKNTRAKSLIQKVNVFECVYTVKPLIEPPVILLFRS